jgi:hypothetical protein
MKFRARLSKENLIVFHGVICQLQRVGQVAAIYLSQDFLRLAVVCDSIDTPRCYSELHASSICTDYRIESLSGNNILFEIGLENFSNALASGRHAMLSMLRLVKRGMRTCLSFETESVEALSLNVTHDIPIRILPTTDIMYYNPPDVPPPSVALELPRSTKLLRVLVDKMSKFAKYIHLTASQAGNLTLKIDHASAVLKTYYSGLTPRYEGNLSLEHDRDNKATIKLEGRKLSLILNHTNLLWDGAFLCKKINVDTF